MGNIWSMVRPAKAASINGTEILEDYWPSAVGLSAVNVIGTHIARPDELKTDPMAYRRPNLSREDKFSSADGDRKMFVISVQLIKSRFDNLTRLIRTLITMHIYILYLYRQQLYRCYRGGL